METFRFFHMDSGLHHFPPNQRFLNLGPRLCQGTLLDRLCLWLSALAHNRDQDILAGSSVDLYQELPTAIYIPSFLLHDRGYGD
jgi:hypothetical protein